MRDRLAAHGPRGSTPGDGVRPITLLTQGFLQGEIVRRVDRPVTIGTFFREEVAEPLGADFHIGFGPEHDHRCGELIPPDMSAMAATMAALGDDAANSIAARAGGSCSLTAEEPRTREWRAAEIGAAGGFGNARSVGRVHSALACGGTVDGVTLMSPETVESILEVQTDTTDLVMMTPLRRHGLASGSAPRCCRCRTSAASTGAAGAARSPSPISRTR